MVKIYKYLKPVEWVFCALIVCLTVGQVKCTMQLMDQVTAVVEAIQNVSYGIGTTGEIWRAGGLMLAWAAASSACQIATTFLAARVSSGLSATLRSKLYAKVESFSIAEVNKFSTDSLITRATNDIQQIHMANVLILRLLIYAPVMAIWAICRISATSWKLTTATVVAVLVLVIGLVAIMLAVVPKFKVVQKLTDRINGVARENITGIRVVRAYNAESYQENKFEKTNTDLTKNHLFTGRVMAFMSPGMMIIMNGLTLAIYWIGASLINAGEMDYAQIVSFMMMATQVVMAFVMLLMMFMMLPRAQVAATRVHEVLNTPLSIKDPEAEVRQEVA